MTNTHPDYVEGLRAACEVLRTEREELLKLARAIVALESSPLQRDHVPPHITETARRLLTQYDTATT